MYEKQMELFEEGGEVDEVSGNNVPLGSTKEEVRDDQPAMLSEGEMVVPADVVRYFGVEYFMNLRDQAKMGYKKMEAMGQFGTEEGQTLPDDTIFNAGGAPFTIEDIEVVEFEDEDDDDTMEAKSGALVRKYAEGGDVVEKTQQVTGTPLLPDAGRIAKLPEAQGLNQLVGNTGIGQFETKFYMDPSGQIHQRFSMEGLPSGEIDEEWIEIDSPFELRSYEELGGGKKKETAPATLARTKPIDYGGGIDPGDDPGTIGSRSFGSLSEWGTAVKNEVGNILDDIGNRMRGEETTSRRGSDFDPGNLDADEYDDTIGTGVPSGYTDPDDDDAAADAESVAAESDAAAAEHGDAGDMGAEHGGGVGDFNRGGSVRKYAVGGMTDDLLKTGGNGQSDPNLGIISPYQAVQNAMQQELPEDVFSALSQAPEQDKQAVANFVNSNYQVSDETTKNFAGSTFGRSYPDDAPIDINSIAAGMIAPKDGQLRGSLSELARTITPASAQNTKNFGALKDSLIGNALLDVLGIMTQYALNPAPGPISIVQGIASIMSPEVAKGFNDLKGIPQKEAAAAQRIANTMNYSLQQLTPEQISQVGLYSTATAMGLDPANMPANQSIVSVNTNIGEQLGILSGTPGKGFSHVSLADGSIISTNSIKDTLNLNPDVYNNTVQITEDMISRNMESAIAPPEAAGEIASAMQGGPGGFGSDDTPDDTINSGLGGYDYSSEGDFGFGDSGGDTGGGEESGNSDGADSGGSGAAADTGASGPDGGVGGPGDFKRGGFVQKRKKKKKKKRRGLAGR